ncbi:hypothetical protein [Vallicoccus soli]|uniref:DUF4439 domain-containing protein n=1 Tax=Vallicoccus soli TaxID=2339232 RepID=A0A3A3YTV4_9ACTN|nr:hypothetical protein [Vallicoccus soli]RJK94885.1 hypothetical protein D5H78_13905 [Vallicoccus soli]
MGTRRTRALTTSLLVTAALAAGCGSTTTTSGASPGAGEEPAPGPVLRVDATGGFTSPQELAARLPLLVVEADGTAHTSAAVPAVYPGPALRPVATGTLPAEQVDRLVQALLDAGVGGDPDLGEPPVADATTTRVTLRHEGREHVLEAYALAEAVAPDPALTAEQQDARARLAAAVEEAAAAVQGAATSPYEPAAVAALVAPVPPGPADPAVGARTPVPWPGPALPGEPLGEGVEGGCVVARGAQADAVLDAAADADALTPWTSGGAEWSVVLRPLLPGEEGCADLTGRAR